jgi:hypothetical protein
MFFCNSIVKSAVTIFVAYCFLTAAHSYAISIDVTNTADMDNLSSVVDEGSVYVSDLSNRFGSFSAKLKRSYAAYEHNVNGIEQFSDAINAFTLLCNKELGAFYLYAGIGSDDIGNSNSLNASMTGAYVLPFLPVSVIKAGGSRGLLDAGALSLYAKIPYYKGFMEYSLKNQGWEFLAHLEMKNIEDVGLPPIDSEIDTVPFVTMYQAYGFFSKTMGKHFDVSCIASFATSTKSLYVPTKYSYTYNEEKDSTFATVKQSYVAYYTPSNEFAVYAGLVWKNRFADIVDTKCNLKLPFFSFRDNYFRIFNYESISRIYGTAKASFSVELGIQLTHEYSLALAYELSSQPYDSYAYFQNDNSYIAHHFNTSLHVQF